MRILFNTTWKLFLFLAIVVSCNQKSEKNRTQLYSFAETTDPEFCNPDSITASDCALGDLYLSKNGNAIYIYYCLGSDSETYNIGKYSISESGISCVFERSYSYYSPEDSDADVNAGTLIATKPFSIDLKKISCKKYEYYFLLDKEKYVVSKSSKKASKNFFGNFRKIKVLSELVEK